MGSAILRPLDESLAYIYCSICRNNGTPNVPLRRQMHQIVCSINPAHIFSWEQLQRTNPDMVPMSAVLTEQPSPTSIAWKIFVAPRTKETLETKLAGRIHVTIGTLLDSLADDQVIFIQGSEAAELKKRGMSNGATIISALNSYAQLEKDRTEAVAKLERLTQILRSVGVEE